MGGQHAWWGAYGEWLWVMGLGKFISNVSYEYNICVYQRKGGSPYTLHTPITHMFFQSSMHNPFYTHTIKHMETDSLNWLCPPSFHFFLQNILLINLPTASPYYLCNTNFNLIMRMHVFEKQPMSLCPFLNFSKGLERW